MKSLDINRTGRLAIVAGIVAVFGTIALLGFFATGGILGFIGDVIGLLGGILLIPLSIGLGNITMPQNRNAGRAIQILGVVSGLLQMTSAFLITSQLQNFQESAGWGYVGSILLGIVVFLFVLTNRSALNFGRAYIVFSLIYGVAMVANILSFVFEDDFLRLLEGSAGLGDINPVLMVLLFTLSPFSVLGPPIWFLWTGRLLRKAGQQVSRASPISS